MNEQEILNYCRAGEILYIAKAAALKLRTVISAQLYKYDPRGQSDEEAPFSYLMEIRASSAPEGDLVGDLITALKRKCKTVLTREHNCILAKLLQEQTFRLKIVVSVIG